MKSKSFENLDIYQLAEKLSDRIWNMVGLWNRFAKDTVGKQLVRSADSVGANIAEGTGRGSYQDNRRFVKIARGSLYETRHWLRRSYQRKLIYEKEVTQLKAILDELSPKLNAYLNSIGKSAKSDKRQMIDDQGHMTNDQKQRTNDK
ncbi:MAG: four helix bundle protein [Gammaproteobacteria bacterium]|nr:MAG: four helix bundle protein [Gammaproteobacteria bacterium]